MPPVIEVTDNLGKAVLLLWQPSLLICGTKSKKEIWEWNLKKLTYQFNSNENLVCLLKILQIWRSFHICGLDRVVPMLMKMKV